MIPEPGHGQQLSGLGVQPGEVLLVHCAFPR